MEKLKPYSYAFNVFVGIPDSSLYKYVLANNLCEYIDDIGLVYLSGYDIKAKFFYGMDSKCLVDYNFKQRTEFDKKLLKELRKNELRKKMTKLTVSILPDSVVEVLRKMRNHE